MNDEKIYCGNGKTRNGQYGEFYSISICLDDIPQEHITTAKNGKRYAPLTVSKKKETDQYGKDISVTVDTWKPSNEPKQAHTPKQEYASNLNNPDRKYIIDDNSDLPF